MQTRNIATRRGDISTAKSIHKKEENPNSFIPGLDENGKKLKHSKEIKGPNKYIWKQKTIDEFSRLFDNQTVKPIHPNHQPHNRKKIQCIAA
jgi:hypothetical protein